MTGEQIICLRADVQAVGVVGFEPATGALAYCEGVGRGRLMDPAEATGIMQRVWNQLPALLEEMSGLAEDYQRMRVALESVQASSMYAIGNTTARSNSPEDYFQAMDAEG